MATSRCAWPSPIGEQTKSARRRRLRARVQRCAASRCEAGEVAEHQVDLHRVAGLRAVARAFERDERAAGAASASGRRPRARLERVLVAVDDEHRAATPGRRAPGRVLGAAELERPPRRRARASRRRSRAPSRRSPRSASSSAARVKHAARRRTRGTPRKSRQPVVAVVLRPALVGVEPLVERIPTCSSGCPGARRDGTGAMNAATPRRASRDASAASMSAHPPPSAEPDERSRGRVPVASRTAQRVLDELPVARRPRRSAGPVGAPVAPRVEGQDAEVARQVRDLHLPEPRVRDRRRREEEDTVGSPLAVDLVEDAHAVALDVALLVGVAGAGLLSLGSRGCLIASDSTKSRSSRLTLTGSRAWGA